MTIEPEAANRALLNRLGSLTLNMDEKDQLSPFSRQDEKSFNSYKTPLREAAVLILLIYKQSRLQIVLTRRTDFLPSHQGQVAFPGGKIDKGDKSPAHAALREANEEIGAIPDKIELLGKLPLYQTATGFSITPVVGIQQPPYIFSRAIDEVEEIFELPVDYMMDINSFKRDSLMYKGKSREFWVLPFENYYIWGATAAILRELSGRLNGEKLNQSMN